MECIHRDVTGAPQRHAARLVLKPICMQSNGTSTSKVENDRVNLEGKN